ncbi:helix-turn-helix transcriptional regulator [Actinomadura graeca]|uniref:Helix-turn-helix transcriptional regulator n=1 Tax=Actinomadura graeca TaxID=2750812 RepID=A0ABX8QP92_9ACTN|nr:helix-turn-helix transcriptional regulator [Actinomadura graeca]QXJ19567.1 helix-turn-helix transcriptional regulator [Actinomadura graeca]
MERVTGAQLDILETLLNAHSQQVQLHGWEIMKMTGRHGPTVYRALDRFLDAGWVEREWETGHPDGRPRRRYYSLSPTGAIEARQVLLRRRPKALRRQHRRAPGGTAFPTREGT